MNLAVKENNRRDLALGKRDRLGLNAMDRMNLKFLGDIGGCQYSNKANK
jgi:hypothetical protein